MLLTIISIMSFMILKLHRGLVIFSLHNLFVGGYPFVYFYCAGMSRTVENKDQCFQLTIKYMEPGEL